MTNNDRLFQQIMRARNRVYQVSGPTPLEQHPLPGGGTLLLKREDLSPIHAYKWRGAYNMMASQPEDLLREGVVTASAGNHAQGVALAASRLKCRAQIFMPSSVPRMKAREVARLGGDYVEIVITGDTYNDACNAAHAAAERYGRLYIPAYDDLSVMAGQGTVGDEILMHAIKPDVVFLQIGGGGLAASVACVLKNYSPDIRVIGVEGEEQACMAAAVRHGAPVTLPYVDVFCDGTAVKRAGELTFPYCRDLIDEFMTVSNDDVCAAVQRLWELARTMAEPSGAMGMAGFMRRQEEFRGKNVAVIVSGANMDFARLSWVAGRAGIGLASKQYFEIELPERAGSMLKLLTDIQEAGLNIEDFLYGKEHPTAAYPVLGFAGTPDQFAALQTRLTAGGYVFRNVSSREDVAFRVINYQPDMVKDPFLAVIEFAQRPGALQEFMTHAAKWSNICYFNYANRGELVGRALMGFEFVEPQKRAAFLAYLESEGPHYQAVALDALSKGNTV